MNSHRKTSYGLLAWSITGLGLWLAPGCSLSPRARQEPAHVFSATTPQMLEAEAGAKPLPPRAKYPDEDTTAAAHTTTKSETARMGGSIVRMDGSRRKAVASPTNSRASLSTSSDESTKKKNEFQLTNYTPDEFEQGFAPGGPQFHPAEPRLEECIDGVPLQRMETVAASPLADLFPDEYVFDGGDRNLSAAMHTDRSGLDSEDTVAAFTDHTGDLRTTPSNRVAVYAPRFGSVRTVTGLVADIKVDQALGAKDTIAVDNLKTGHAALENVHETGLYGLQTNDRADGMKSSVPPMQARRTEIAGQNQKFDHGLEGRVFSSPGIFNRNDGIILVQQMRNAITWTREDFPVINAVTTNASEITAKFKVQQTIGVEDERETKGNVHIIKLADREVAQSGDTITFTIRFQNTGDFDVYDVSVVDNLTPRLDYVSGSASIDEEHPGEVIVEPNGEGSSILTFRLDSPLKGHESGTITFDATVR